MKLLRSLGSKPQSGEDGIGGGPLGLPPDPILNPGQAFGRLMDIVAVGNVGKGFKQLFKAFVTGGNGRRHHHAGSASRRYRGPHFFSLSHPSAFPRGIPAVVQSPPAVG